MSAQVSDWGSSRSYLAYGAAVPPGVQEWAFIVQTKDSGSPKSTKAIGLLEETQPVGSGAAQGKFEPTCEAVGSSCCPSQPAPAPPAAAPADDGLPYLRPRQARETLRVSEDEKLALGLELQPSSPSRRCEASPTSCASCSTSTPVAFQVETAPSSPSAPPTEQREPEAERPRQSMTPVDVEVVMAPQFPRAAVEVLVQVPVHVPVQVEARLPPPPPSAFMVPQVSRSPSYQTHPEIHAAMAPSTSSAILVPQVHKSQSGQVTSWVPAPQEPSCRGCSLSSSWVPPPVPPLWSQHGLGAGGFAPSVVDPNILPPPPPLPEFLTGGMPDSTPMLPGMPTQPGWYPSAPAATKPLSSAENRAGSVADSWLYALGM